VVVQYIGRLSHHFIREKTGLYDPNELCRFYLQADIEAQTVVKAFVRHMGGNALLDHRVEYHEVSDHESGGAAFVFATVSGHIVRTSNNDRVVNETFDS
jgi:hypothetical protein